MSSVFKKLLRKEFGKKTYEKLSCIVKENLRAQNIDNTELYQHIYNELHQKDREVITRMNDRLNESMLAAFRISRTYGFDFAVYLGVFFTIAFAANPVVAVPAILFISALFLLKTYEYVINRFCYVDAHIALIYKSVLERLLVDTEGK